MTRPIFTFTVAPSLPEPLNRLSELAYNVLWAWEHELLALFMRLDPDLWEATQHNPVRMLGIIKQERLNALAEDDAFLAQLDRAWERYRARLESSRSWRRKTPRSPEKPVIAYFSAEFGLTEASPNYSGGLGILAGDHLKSASDLGVPLVGVGILYQQGYFRQYLNADGWQQERYPENDFYTMPVQPELTPQGTPVTVTIEYPGRLVTAYVWRAQVGRVRLYLLDTNTTANTAEDQDITDQLYGGDREMRMKQEILLGIGGYRALKAVGLTPTICHLNDGHSAFLVLERCRELMAEHGLSFAEAREAVTAGCVFTTHTSVPAGHDYFAPDLIEKYFAGYAKRFGLSRKEFLGLGRIDPTDDREEFCMTVLALRMAGRSNAVSQLHAVVSREAWQRIWPGVPVEEVPIASITNAVHAPSWISHDMAGLLDRYLGPRWREDPDDPATWQRIAQIPDEELWRTHERRRERLVAFARNRLQAQLEARGAPPSEVAEAAEVLNPEALTIGFARRFATYKRATLLLRDPDRLARLLGAKDRPVQVLFAGKAHPRDNPGKELIRQIIHLERRPGVRRSMVFIEDYDIGVARYLVEGVDVWLNTPRRPQEASGTSGMKAIFNGAINLSVLDGWWAEAYGTNTGWAIGRGEQYQDEAYQDEVESEALYDLLEKEIVPLFYARGTNGLPRAWVARMKEAMRVLCPQFNTDRMLWQYTEECYVPALRRAELLAADEWTRAKALAHWKARVRDGWSELSIAEVKADASDHATVGDSFTVRAWLSLGRLAPEDVSVELCQGVVDARGEIVGAKIVPMATSGQTRGALSEFVGAVTLETSGRHGYTVRAWPNHPDLDEPSRRSLSLWAKQRD